VVNNTGATLNRTDYKVVRVTSAQGQRLAVQLAQANNDLNSAETLGMVCENISNNQEGFIVNVGQVTEINTTGSLQGETWADGDSLYLSATTPGVITNIKPVAPNHGVRIGYVEYAHSQHGKIYVKIDNGYELDELHDVEPKPYINKGVLYRDTATNLWKSASIQTLLGYTPANQATTLTINGTAYDLSANRTWNVGTVTSVNMSVPAGFTISGNPITGSGTLALAMATGYAIPTTASQATWDSAYNDKINSASVTGTTTKTLTLTQQDGGTITTSWTDYDTAPVTSVFGRTGTVTAQSGDYSTTLVTEGTNLYFTDARARAAITLTTTGSSGSATYVGGTLNIPTYTLSGLGGVPTSRTLTINGVSYDLSLDRSWTIPTHDAVTIGTANGLSLLGQALSLALSSGTTNG
ncbi:MAG: hypothetical protein EBU08_21430, partial [Micrococcales bacterium]|nr:hypothetical protein [Micrococcales bacterium]